MIIKKSKLVIASCSSVSSVSNRHARYRLDMLARERRIGYQRLLEMCSKETGREIRDIAELGPGEIDRVMKEIKCLSS